MILFYSHFLSWNKLLIWWFSLISKVRFLYHILRNTCCRLIILILNKVFICMLSIFTRSCHWPIHLSLRYWCYFCDPLGLTKKSKLEFPRFIDGWWLWVLVALLIIFHFSSNNFDKFCKMIRIKDRDYVTTTSPKAIASVDFFSC